MDLYVSRDQYKIEFLIMEKRLLQLQLETISPYILSITDELLIKR